MKRLLFLDIDGVLNNSNYLNKKFKGNDTLLSIYDIYDPVSIQRVNHILSYCDILVLSSDWRDYCDISQMLIQIGINEDMVNNMLKTPYRYDLPERIRRGQEIIDFLTRYKNEEINYVILDDMNFYYNKQKPHLVKVSLKDGLTEYRMNKAIDILTH